MDRQDRLPIKASMAPWIGSGSGGQAAVKRRRFGVTCDFTQQFQLSQTLHALYLMTGDGRGCRGERVEFQNTDVTRGWSKAPLESSSALRPALPPEWPAKDSRTLPSA
jgi:hypothetical protein